MLQDAYIQTRILPHLLTEDKLRYEFVNGKRDALFFFYNNNNRVTQKLLRRFALKTVRVFLRPLSGFTEKGREIFKDSAFYL